MPNWDELNKPLDPKHVKSRNQAGQNLSYIEGHHAIREANRIFDFDGWDRTTEILNSGIPIQQQEIDNKWRVGYNVKVTILVKDGPTREGVGSGQGIDKDLFRAHESAIKEAETDAMKRALMTFGDPFGLALYDKKQEHVGTPDDAKKQPSPPATNGQSPVTGSHVTHNLTAEQATEIKERIKPLGIKFSEFCKEASEANEIGFAALLKRSAPKEPSPSQAGAATPSDSKTGSNTAGATSTETTKQQASIDAQAPLEKLAQEVLGT